MAYLNNIYNFRAIGPLLSTSGQPTEDQIRVLAEERYEMIINLALHDDPRYSLKDETGLVESLGMKYIHIPVQFDSPGEPELLAFFEAMETSSGKLTHVHCAANMRVTAFLGLYNIIRKNMPAGDAFAPMQSVWEPNETWAGFISAMLEKYAAG